MTRTSRDLQLTAYAHAVHPNGGMERAQREVALGLLERGWRVRLVTRDHDLPHHPNLEIVRVRVPARPAPLEQLAFAARAPRVAPGPAHVVTALGAIVPWPVDVVVVQYVNHAARGMRTVHGSGVKRVLLRFNGAVNHEIAVGLERWCYRPRRVQRFLPVSGQLRDGLATLAPWSAAASAVVPNGVDPAHFAPDSGARERTRAAHGIPASARVAVFVGGDWERKGLLPAIEALATATDWYLLVVGRGAAQAYRDDARRLGCVERLHFAGESRDPAPLLAAGDVFVLPTRYEGFPLSALEAASTGLALLLTRESNADGLLLDGQTGFWVRRDGADIAARLDDLADPLTRAAIGDAARRAAARFAWSEIVDRHVAIYHEILASRRAG
jgi:glycosyltransferase involved in cell wall biosynthesis